MYYQLFRIVHCSAVGTRLASFHALALQYSGTVMDVNEGVVNLRLIYNTTHTRLGTRLPPPRAHILCLKGINLVWGGGEPGNKATHRSSQV